MPRINALALEGQIERVAALPVCAVVGADEAQAARSVQMLVRAAAPPDQPGSTVLRLEGEVAAHEVFDDLRTIPFLGLAGRRAVVVEDGAAFLKAHADRLVGYLKDPVRTSTLILRTAKLDGRSRAAKAMVSTGAIIECGRLRWADARAWLHVRAEAMGTKLAPQAASDLVEAVGTDLLALGMELDKLIAYADGERSITPEHVGEVVTHGRQRSIFDLGNAVVAGDAAGALRLCGGLLLRGERREYIISMLARQVRRLWSVHRLRADGASQQDIGRSMGMQDWMVRRALNALRGISDEWFARQLEILAAADWESKSKSLRTGEERVWLEGMLARLCERRNRSRAISGH